MVDMNDDIAERKGFSPMALGPILLSIAFVIEDNGEEEIDHERGAADRIDGDKTKDGEIPPIPLLRLVIRSSMA